MYTSANSEVKSEEDQGSKPPSTPRVEIAPSKSTNSILNPKASGNWTDWKWQMRHRIRTAGQLINHIPSLRTRSTELATVTQKYPMAITPYYASLIEKSDAADPVFKMCVPQLDELFNPSCLREDPLEENEDMPVPGLVHRYPDRALLIATTTCSAYCRHCTRKRLAGMRESVISVKRLEQVVSYLSAHPEIRDVIVSGGDPLTMPTDAVATVLSRLRSVKTVEIIRIGTRVPVVLPMRITDELVTMLRKFHPLWINTHFNHPNELTPEAAAACAKLADAGIPLGNQTVLLRGVNDTPQIIEQLCRGLVRMRVRPYYLYQCDLVRGIEHFRTPLTRGIEIIEYLRGRVSGIAIPNFVVDGPHGAGKVPLMPNYVVSVSPTHTVLRNHEGMLVNYPEPNFDDTSAGQPATDNAAGVWELACGKGTVIQPADTCRAQRREKITERNKKTSGPQCGFLFDM